MTLRLRRDDVVPGLLLSAQLFLAVASTVIAKAARDAIFLTRYTPLQMTAVDIATVAAVAVVLAAQLRVNGESSIRRLLVYSPLCFAFVDVALWAGTSAPHRRWIAAVTYVSIGIQASIVVSQASALAYQVLTIRQAKRVCTVVGTGAMLGSIAGGLLTRRTAASFGAPSLLLEAAVLTALCPVVVSLSWREKTHGAAVSPGVPRLDASSFRQHAAAVWRSPHLRALAALSLLSSAVTTIVGLQFKAVASQSIGAGDRLAVFFGSFTLQTGSIALAAQLLFTRRILGAVGVGPALAIAPVALGVGSLGVLVSGTLASAVLLRGSDQVLRYSVDRSAVEFLYRPLSAPEVFETKTFIDAFVCRFGDLIGGAIALVGTSALHLNYAWLSVTSLALAVAWLIATVLASNRYRLRLLENLSGHQSGSAIESRRRLLSRATHGSSDVLARDSNVRLETLRQLAAARGRGRRARVKNHDVTTALAAEIIGLAVLTDQCGEPGTSAADDRQAVRAAIERISLLLYLLSPAQYPDCLLRALQSCDASQADGAIEYLDTTLTAPHRHILIPLLDRSPLVPK